MKFMHLIGALTAAACAMALSLSMVSISHADESTADDGPLGKIHNAEGVKCVKCHGTAKKTDPVPQETCLSCHGDGDSKKLAASTAKVKPVNPHENRHYGTEADCNLCHHVHVPSVNYCADCHPRYDLKPK